MMLRIYFQVFRAINVVLRNTGFNMFFNVELANIFPTYLKRD